MTGRSLDGIGPTDRRDAQGATASPLIGYTLRGLRQCWLPELGRWSHIYHLDGRPEPNESLPPSDVFYTLNVLLGLSRLPAMPEDIDALKIFRRNVLHLTRLPVARYAFGMALWTAARLGGDLPPDVKQAIHRLLTDRACWEEFRAQDIGMLLTGVAAQVRAGNREWEHYAAPLFRFLRERYHAASGLFFDAPAGFRRRFASFATQTYLTIACYHHGEIASDDVAIAMANGCARKLIELQGPGGEWPWFFDALHGRVVDFYEVYSVHQYGMAPAWLELAQAHTVDGAQAAMVRGFNWMFGANEMKRAMFVPELCLSIRSQVRKGELKTRKRRVLRAIGNAYAQRSAGLIGGAGLELRLECRSYELGWILWSFAQRGDVPELTHHPLFAAALSGDCRIAAA